MAERHEFFGQVGDDPLGAAIKPGGNAFHKRRDLRDFHYYTCARPSEMNPPRPRKFHDNVTSPNSVLLHEGQRLR